MEEPAKAQIEIAEQRLFELARSGEIDRGAMKLEKALAASLQMAERVYKRDSHVTGIATGLTDLDRKLGGLQKSDLVILAGRPSMGKTALATTIAFNAARAYAETCGKDGVAILFFSLEMSAEQLATRLLGERASVPADRIRRGEIKAEDFQNFLETSKLLSRAPLYIDDAPALSVAAIRSRARRMKRQLPHLGAIVIDYLQLLHSSGRSVRENRTQEVSDITQALKALAKELDLPVVALSQLNRGLEQREDKRPQLSDLRDSGSIEQDADLVIFVYREDYYHSRSEPSQRADENAEKFNRRHQDWVEPPRVRRRLFGLSHAASLAGSSRAL